VRERERACVEEGGAVAGMWLSLSRPDIKLEIWSFGIMLFSVHLTFSLFESITVFYFSFRVVNGMQLG
jgi:hypothetical protein